MTVNVSLNGDGLNYSTEADLLQAAKIIGFLNTTEALPLHPSAIGQETGLLDSTVNRPLTSPREAMIESGAKTNAQKILVLGNYIQERDTTDHFVPNELKTVFAKAGEPAPKNLRRDIEGTVRLGYIMENPEVSGQYMITNLGYSSLRDGFSNANTNKPKRSGGKTASKGASKTVSIPEWLTSTVVEDRMEGYKSYRMMNTRSDKILWILQWGNQNGHPTLTGPEIAAVADKLGTSVPNKQITSAVNPYLVRDFISKSSTGYKIMHNGTEYLMEVEN